MPIDANSVAVSFLLSVNSIVLGASGSGRLLDTSAAQIAQFNTSDKGGRVWVETIQDTFHWDPASAAVADNITICNPTANGVANGRFIRDGIPSLLAQKQVTWHIDETNGDNENDGLLQASALKSDAELQRRLGYRALCSAVTTVHTYGNVTRLTNTRLYAPSMYTIHQAHGATVAYTSTGFTTHTNYAPATNIEQQATDAGVPTGTWSGAGFTPLAGRAAHRVRFTTGNVGGVMWVKHELGAGAANFSRCIIPSSDPTTAPKAGVNIVDGDDFVVETLPICNQLIVDIAFQDAGALFFGEVVIFNDYAFAATVAFTNTILAPAGGIRCNGCDMQNLVPEIGTIFAVACNVDGPFIGQFGDAGQYWMQGCCIVGVNSGSGPGIDSGSLIISEFTCSEGVFLFSAGYGTRVIIACGGSFRSTNTGAQITAGANVSAQPLFGTTGGTGVFFGQTNTARGVQFFHGSNLAVRVPANVTITGATGDFAFAGNVAGVAWDPTTATYLLAARNYTWVLFGTTVAGGGFGSSLFDPLTGCSIVLSSS